MGITFVGRPIAIAGQQFELGSEEWYQFIECCSADDRVDYLFNYAMMDFSVYHRLMLHDKSLHELFATPPEIRAVMTGSRFRTLSEMAVAVLAYYEKQES